MSSDVPPRLRRDAAITANVINLEHALGLEAIAEGIESPEQLAAVQALGCDQAQGFLFGRPVAPDDLTFMLTKHPDLGATTEPAMAAEA